MNLGCNGTHGLGLDRPQDYDWPRLRRVRWLWRVLVVAGAPGPPRFTLLRGLWWWWPQRSPGYRRRPRSYFYSSIMVPQRSASM